MLVPVLEHGCSSRSSSDEEPAPCGAAVGSPTLCYGGSCFSFIREMQSSDDNLGCSNLCISNTKRASSSQSPFQIVLLQKWKQKMIAKLGRPSGLGRSEQPFPTQREKESYRERETEITHNTIYCPKTASSTKGTTVIIGEKRLSPLTCKSDLRCGSLPSTRALGSQERRARRRRAAARGIMCRSEGHLTERGVFSPPLA